MRLQPLRLLLLLLRVAAAVAVVVAVVLPATALPLRPLLRCCPSVRVCCPCRRALVPQPQKYLTIFQTDFERKGSAKSETELGRTNAPPP